MAKVRTSFVTNSSSSSFVVSKKEIGDFYTKYIEEHFSHISKDELYFKCQECDVYDAIYYLVDYEPTDEYMHIWVRRDEAMCDSVIDDVLYDYDKDGEVTAKFYYHY